MGSNDEFARRLAEAFDELEVGRTFVFRRTFTDGDVSMFCGVTGDYNPYHLDDEFAAASGLGRRIVPGLLTASMGTHIGGLLGFLSAEMHLRFQAPVYIGDTITCTATVASKDEERRRVRVRMTAVNHEGTEVLTAEVEGFPTDVRLKR